MVLIKKTIQQILIDNIKNYPNELSIVSDREDTQITWKQLDGLTSVIAQNLLRLGFKKGDKVAILSANTPKWIITFFACNKLGMICVPINTNFKEEIEYVLNASECKAIFFQEQFRKNNLLSTISNIKDQGTTTVNQYISMDTSIEGFLSFDELLQAHTEELPYEQVTCEEVAVLLFTSGTTGFPKGVMLTHYNLINNALALKEALRLSEKDSVCIAAPLFHCFGLTASMLVASLAGAKMAILKECSTKSLIETLTKYKCSVLNGVPTMFNSLISYEDLAQYDLSKLEKGIIAGAKYTSSLFVKISEKLQMPYLMASYGQTECSPACTMVRLEDSLEVRSASVGKVMEHVMIELRDPQTQQSLHAGQQGEICVKGYNVMKGYCNAPNSHTIDEAGWLHTGDLGYQDGAGNYYITGRLKDLIIRGGENISPFEIEEVIGQLDNIMTCQVVGVPDEKYGEEVAACLVVKDKSLVNEEAIKTYVGERLAKYKSPKYIFVLDKLCMTASGKVSKALLKEKVQALLEMNKLA